MFDLLAYAVLIWVPVGIFVGYRWRDRCRASAGLDICRGEEAWEHRGGGYPSTVVKTGSVIDFGRPAPDKQARRVPFSVIRFCD
jgi:hypothetical protein